MNTIFILLITNYITVLTAEDIDYYRSETRLKKKIFEGYDKNVKPSKTVNISFDTSLKQIVSLDEKNQIITTSIYFYATWYDERLVWDQSEYNETDSIKISATQIWLPDLFVINTADTNGFITISNSNLAVILKEGTIYLTLGLIGKL